MFLTTNRVESIDPAFMSRIHLSLYYPPLSPEIRRSLWKDFVIKGSGLVPPDWLNDELLDRLASYKVNGRQVKNTIRMACSISANEQRDLRPEDILSGLEALNSFETDFGMSNQAKRLPTSETKSGLSTSTESFTTAQYLRHSLRRMLKPRWGDIAIISGLTALATGSAFVGVLTFLRWYRKGRS